MELEFTKNVKKKPYNYLLDLIFALFSWLKLGCNDIVFESKVGKKKQKN
jgi:hypothetical protein